MRTVTIVGALFVFAVLATDATGARVGKRQLWGSIAYSTQTGAYGYAVDRKTKREAEAEAFRGVGIDRSIVGREAPYFLAWPRRGVRPNLQRLRLTRAAGCNLHREASRANLYAQRIVGVEPGG